MKPWRPLLSGSLAKRAADDARSIAADLARLRRPDEIAPSYGADVAASLGTGSAGLAVALFALEAAGLAPGGDADGLRFLEASTDAMADAGMDPDLFGGFTGVAWAVAHLTGGDEGDGSDPLDAIDPAVFEIAEEGAASHHFDLVSGLTGFGLYALERLPRPEAARAVEAIVAELASRAESRPGGLAWRTRPEHLSPLQAKENAEGWYDLGVAHGAGGLVGFLAQACAAGVAERPARELLDGAVAFLLAERASSPGGLAYWIPARGERTTARSAWCYGDPGVAAVLLLAARCVGEPAWEKAAVRIALEAAARAPEETGVVDASLCHGAAGLAHLFNRVHQRTGDGDLGRAATEWFERALAMRTPGKGHGGYLTGLKARDGSLSYEPDPSLLSGSAGVALAFAAAATPSEPEWDRMLLLSSGLER